MGAGLLWRKLCSNRLFSCCHSGSFVTVDCCCSSQKKGVKWQAEGFKSRSEQTTQSPHRVQNNICARVYVCVAAGASLSDLYWLAVSAAPKQSPTNNIKLNFSTLVATRVRRGKERSGLQCENRETCGIVKSIVLKRAKQRSIATHL